MKRTLFALMFLSFNLLAQDYTLIQPENKHYQDYSLDEFKDRLGAASELLSYYQCNGVNEFELFWAPQRQNENGNSLRIKFQKDDTLIYYRFGSFHELNGAVIKKLKDPFVKEVRDALEKIEKVPEGAKLLRFLERSYYPLTIALGGNHFNSMIENGDPWKGIYRAQAIASIAQGRMSNESSIIFNDIGVGGRIQWDPKTKETSPYIVLAHEMFHAFDSIRGLLDGRIVEGKDYERGVVAEYRATYLENIMRKAAKKKLRTHYGEENEKGPGLLDQNGKPRLIPSPCIKAH